MGALLKALSPVSSYAAKKTDLWADIQDRIDGALFPAMLDEVEQWLRDNELNVPIKWHEPIADLIERRREELRSEDIGQILLDRYDF
jgi:hypothetical protein